MVHLISQATHCGRGGGTGDHPSLLQILIQERSRKVNLSVSLPVAPSSARVRGHSLKLQLMARRAAVPRRREGTKEGSEVRGCASAVGEDQD